ncbi:MAG: Arm DNA-binding domain-containing protein [Mangrovibacterium sp.]
MQTFGIQFITRQNKDQDSVKNHTIYARITVNGSRSEVSLKQNITPEERDPFPYDLQPKVEQLFEGNCRFLRDQ